jgi:hypothetical protein
LIVQNEIFLRFNENISIYQGKFRIYFPKIILSVQVSSKTLFLGTVI